MGCEELGLNADEVERVRKMPNTRSEIYRPEPPAVSRYFFNPIRFGKKELPSLIHAEFSKRNSDSKCYLCTGFEMVAFGAAFPSPF